MLSAAKATHTRPLPAAIVHRTYRNKIWEERRWIRMAFLWLVIGAVPDGWPPCQRRRLGLIGDIIVGIIGALSAADMAGELESPSAAA